MTDTTVRQTSLPTDADYEAEFNRLLQEMTHIDAQMQKDRAEGERLWTEARIIAARTDAMLDQLEEQLDRLQRRA